MSLGTIVTKKNLKLVGKSTTSQIPFALGLKQMALNNELKDQGFEQGLLVHVV
jgi:hypothetical protein